VKRLKKLGNYKCPVDIDFEKRPELLNLSTCSGSSGTNRRLVVHCVKVGNI
jgi:sortase B